MESDVPTMHDLRETFRVMSDSQYNGIPGVLRISSSGDPHPVVGITAMTHGNEPSGLAAISYFLRDNLLQTLLNETGRGSVIFSVNNMQAADAYFSLPPGATEQEKEAYRFLDINMNRLPMDALSRIEDTRREISRVLALYNGVFREFDAGLDIHSLRVSNMQMIVEVKGNGKKHARHFPMENIITNIVQVQTGQPVSKLYGGVEKAIPVVGIEAGRHEHDDAFRYAIASAKAFLESIGILPGSAREMQSTLTEYAVRRGVLPPEEGYSMVSTFGMFDAVQDDTVLMKHAASSKEVQAGMRGHILMGLPAGTPLRVTEEAYFLSEPKKALARDTLS